MARTGVLGQPNEHSPLRSFLRAVDGHETTVPSMTKGETETGRIWTYVATIGHSAARTRLWRSIAPHPIARANIPSNISIAIQGKTTGSANLYCVLPCACWGQLAALTSLPYAPPVYASLNTILFRQNPLHPLLEFSDIILITVTSSLNIEAARNSSATYILPSSLLTPEMLAEEISTLMLGLGGLFDLPRSDRAPDGTHFSRVVESQNHPFRHEHQFKIFGGGMVV